MRRRNIANPEFCDCMQKPHQIRKLEQRVQELGQQLNESHSKNQEYLKLISILTEERNFYQDELKRIQQQRDNTQEAICRFKNQMDSKQLLVNELKKSNRLLESELSEVRESLEETRFMFQAQEQQIQRIVKEKQLIEAEWNKVIKDVNSKMTKMNKKQNEERKQNFYLCSNLPLDQRVKRALRKIDQELQSEESGLSLETEIFEKDYYPSTAQQQTSGFSL